MGSIANARRGASTMASPVYTTMAVNASSISTSMTRPLVGMTQRRRADAACVSGQLHVTMIEAAAADPLELPIVPFGSGNGCNPARRHQTFVELEISGSGNERVRLVDARGADGEVRMKADANRRACRRPHSAREMSRSVPADRAYTRGGWREKRGSRVVRTRRPRSLSRTRSDEGCGRESSRATRARSHESHWALPCRCVPVGTCGPRSCSVRRQFGRRTE